MESWRLCEQKSRVWVMSSPEWVARSEEMAPPAAALAATAALLAATFPGCTSYSEQHLTACSRAKIAGKVVCLRPGERCSSRHERIYRSYALTCRKGVLRQRNYIGPANP
jgi:hypothetical protein